MKRFVFSTAATLLLAPCSFAILDVNENGVSDLWEKQFNEGELFDVSFDPQGDDDHDKWSNVKEAAAGTDPFNPNPPDGLVQPLTGHTPEVTSEPDEYGHSYVITPEAVTVSWPTLVGKQYTLLFSPDLSAGSWLPIGGAFIGNGNEVTYGFTISESDKRFWRVAVCDVDSDSDRLTDHEEFLSGTNPATADSDGDGMSDYFESINGFDSNNSSDAGIDTDNDGLSNLQELILGTDPNAPDNPGILQEAIRNGDFSIPSIDSPGKNTNQSGTEPDWNYWEGLPEPQGEQSWKAATEPTGNHIEYQRLPDSDNQYCELKAEPAGNNGIKQKIGTRKEVTYLLAFDCSTRDGTAASDNNIIVRVDGTQIGAVEFESLVSGEWLTKVFSFKASHVITEIELVPQNPENAATYGCFVDHVVLLPVEINSLDRFVRGSIDLDTVENLFGGIDNFGVQFVGKSTDQTYGESSLAEAYIHEEDYLNSEDEAAQPLESLEEKSWKQNVIYYKKDGKLYFMTTVDQIDDFEIKLFKEGEELAAIDYGLTGIPEVTDFIDELDRTFGQMPFANNGEIPSQYIAEATGPEYDEFFPDETTGPPPLMAALSSPFDPVEWRNLTTRCMEALFDELEKKASIVAGKVEQGGEVILKQTVGYASGYLRGLWGGLKSDWEGIIELRNLLIHPIDTSRSIYESFKALLGLSFDDWKQLSNNMLDSMMDSAKEALPWDYQGDNIADQAGLISHISGYATGFVSEQALMIYLGAGAVSKIGQTVKVIVNSSKVGGLAAELAAKGLNAARNLARRTKTSAQKYWSQFADSESDLARIAANMEGSHRRPGTAGYDNSFLNAQRAAGEAFEDLDNLTMEKLLKELGDKDAFKELDAPDFFGRSHAMQFQRRAAQLATTLKKAGALSEDALIGFAKVYKRLIKDAAVDGGGVAIRERVRDLTDLFDTNLAYFGTNLDAQQVKGAKALAKSLEDYKVRSEAANFDGKFWFKDVETVYDVAYKYSSWPGPQGGWSNYDGILPEPTWCTFGKIDTPELANDLLLLPGPNANPRYRVEFDTSEIVNKARLSRGEGDTDFVKEPLTRDVPVNHIPAGTGKSGGETQIYVEGSVNVKRVVDLHTGNTVWEAPGT